MRINTTPLDYFQTNGRQDSPSLRTSSDRHSSKWSLQTRLLSLQGWGLIDLPLRASNEGLLRPRVARAQKIIRLHSLLSSSTSAEGIPTRGWLGGSSTARVERALFHRARSTSKRSPLTALTISSAPPSTPSPPSPSAAPRLWPVPAPSRRRGVAAETLQQRLSCAPLLF